MIRRLSLAAHPGTEETDGLRALLSLYLEWGADTIVTDSPHDRFAQASAPGRIPPPSKQTPGQISGQEEHKKPAVPGETQSGSIPGMMSDTVRDIASLSVILDTFDDCSLRKTAMRTVLPEGPPGAPVMIIGDAPDADEDRSGRFLSGQAGQLITRMFSSIGMDRTLLSAAPAIPWRPPGGRPPSQAEIEVCLPFLLKAVGLLRPERLLLCGSLAARMMTGRKDPLSHLRGEWHHISLLVLSADGIWEDKTIPALVMRHPLQLRASATARRESWEDMLRLSVSCDDTTHNEAG